MNRVRTGRLGLGVAAACLAVMLLILSSSAPLNAQAPDPAKPMVDVALVLAIDASGSVSDDRFELQKQGFAAAFRNQKVLAAIRAGDHRAIAVFMLQWTGPPEKEIMVPWTYVSDEISAGRVAAAIKASAPADGWWNLDLRGDRLFRQGAGNQPISCDAEGDRCFRRWREQYRAPGGAGAR